MKLHKPIFTLLLLTLSCSAQEIFHDCPMTGDAKSDRVAVADSLKNRYVEPTNITPITLDTMLKSTENNLDQNQGVSVEGYVVLVKDGSLETCNCHSKIYKDIHIELVMDSTDTDKSDGVIVEVTPRFKDKHPDWTTALLKKLILGHKVRITGFLFYDKEHENASKNTRSNGKHDWRGTCWEIHPITNIEVIN